MNQTQATDKLSVLIKLTALLILTLTLVACDSTKSVLQEPKVVQVIDREVVKHTEKNGLVINSFNQGGAVSIGKLGTGVRISHLPGMMDKPFVLEGRASLGDPYILVFHVEDQLLEGGQVRTVVKSIGVRSANQEKYEKYFSDSKK